MSEEIIKVLDNLAERFGVAVDWTSTNVIPYLQELCSKYITYEIATSVTWLVIGILCLIFSKYTFTKTKYFWSKYKEDIYSDYDFGVILFGVITGCMIIAGIIVILYQTFNIITCLTFPEKIIIDELSSIYLNMK